MKYFFLLLFYLNKLNSNNLYEIFPVKNGYYNLKTINLNITKLLGLELGKYKDINGLFFTSISLNCIYFINLNNYYYNIIAGIPYSSGNNDGQLLYSTFNNPSRLLYYQNKNQLFITEKLTGIIRIIDFNSDQVKSLYYINNEGNKELLQFESNVQTGGDFPGLDIKLSNNILYVVDTIKLYQISSIVTDNGQEIATVIEYTNLATYMDVHGYPVSANLRSCIYSVAPDEKRKVLYVSISYAKNLILQVPMDPNESYEKISVLLGDESLTFQGNVIGFPPPKTRNGNIKDSLVNSDGTITTGASNILLSFPVHLRLSYSSDILYFSEAYPTTSDGHYLFGSLTVRRYKIPTGDVDTYCGIDFSTNIYNESYFNLIGSTGGFIDGDITTAAFTYPITITVVPSNSELNAKDKNKNNELVNFHEMYVIDYPHNAIRHIYASMDTSHPTPSPTTYFPPTSQPTQLPTISFISSLHSLTDLNPYQMTLIIVGSFFFCFFFCYFWILCFSKKSFHDESKHEGSNHDDEEWYQNESETSHSGFFRTPIKNPTQKITASTVHDYVVNGWNQVNRRIQMATNLNRNNINNHDNNSNNYNNYNKNKNKSSNSSSDGQNGLLDVSISSSTSSLENDEWEDVVWTRSPNFNINKQYRLSETKWSIAPNKVDNLHINSNLELSDRSNSVQRPDVLIETNWSNITPFASRETSNNSITNTSKSRYNSTNGRDNVEVAVTNINENSTKLEEDKTKYVNREDVVDSNSDNNDYNYNNDYNESDDNDENDDSDDDNHGERTKINRKKQNGTVYSNIVQWLTGSSHSKSSNNTNNNTNNHNNNNHNNEEFNHNNNNNNNNNNNYEENQNPIHGSKTPPTNIRKWKTSNWDQLDETVVALQFE